MEETSLIGMKDPKILHIAWLGAGNFGDDLMAAGLHPFLLERYAPSEILLWCNGRPRNEPHCRWIYESVRGSGIVRAFQRFHSRIQAMSASSLIIIGGGSVMHSANSTAWKRRVVDGMRFFNRNRKAVGTGLSVGPFKDDIDKRYCSDLLTSLDQCAFRDSASYEFACGLNLSYKPVKAFDLSALFLENFTGKMSVSQQASGIVGLAVRIPFRSGKEDLLKRYVEIVRLLGRKYEKVRLLSLSTGPYEDDSGYCRAIKDSAGLGNVEIAEYSGDVEGFTRTLSDCDFIISAKFHGFLVPFLLGIPFLAISYHRKFEDFAQDTGIPQERIFSEEDFRPAEILERMSPWKTGNRERYFEMARLNLSVFMENQ
jgi:polysaccharide pyruvyl transferase WcaK-like protein